MTSKTFKSALDSPVTLEVERETHPAGVYLTIGQATILLGASDAPALALAILEAAGVVPAQRDYESYDDGTPAHLQAVAYFLKQHNEAQERATAEARELAELEAEALELLNAWRAEGGEKLLERWDAEEGDMIHSKPFWLAVARRAREMRAEK